MSHTNRLHIQHEKNFVKIRAEQKKGENKEISSQIQQEVMKIEVEDGKVGFHQHLQPSQRYMLPTALALQHEMSNG